MALQTEIVNFTLRVGIGSQVVPLVRYPSMVPKAIVICFASSLGGGQECFSYGLDDGVTHIGNGIGLGERFGVSLSARSYSGKYSLTCESTDAFFGGAIPRVRSYVSAVAAGSFTVQTDLNQLPGSGWTAFVIGGSDVQCVVGVYDVGLGSGSVVLGFDPVAILKLGSVQIGTDGQVAGANIAPGFAVICDTQQVGWGISCGSIAPNSTSYLIGGVVQEDIESTVTTITDPVSVGFIPNGFSVTVSGTPLWRLGYLAIGGTGVSANLVQILNPSSVGGQNTAIQATDPVAALFGSVCKIPTPGVGNVDANVAFGMHDGLTDRSFWWGTVNGSAFPYPRDAQAYPGQAITMSTPTAVTAHTINAQATCALSAGNISLNWGIASAPAREFWALVLANNPGTGVCGGVTPIECVPSPPAVPSSSTSPTAFSSSAVSPNDGVIVQ